MMTRRQFTWLVPLAALTWGLALGAAPADDATVVVKRAAEQMLRTLEARRAEVDRNPALIYGMIDSILAPHFDFQKITQGVLGKNWSKASPAQQQALMNGFKELLVRTYARSLLNYSGQEIRYLPPKQGAKPGWVIVPTEVRESGATPIPIDYWMYDNGTHWKVFDVFVNKVSLVSNYRSDFSNQIQQNGIDGLISRLGEMNRKGQG
jgi:phospholipid transport system substrate-binding protein